MAVHLGDDSKLTSDLFTAIYSVCLKLYLESFVVHFISKRSFFCINIQLFF